MSLLWVMSAPAGSYNSSSESYGARRASHTVPTVTRCHRCVTPCCLVRTKKLLRGRRPLVLRYALDCRRYSASSNFAFGKVLNQLDAASVDRSCARSLRRARRLTQSAEAHDRRRRVGHLQQARPSKPHRSHSEAIHPSRCSVPMRVCWTIYRHTGIGRRVDFDRASVVAKKKLTARLGALESHSVVGECPRRRNMNTSALFLSRLQFVWVIGWHILLPALPDCP
jgi:hypothetical protein